MSEFFDDLPTAEQEMLVAVADLRDAREAAQRAARTGEAGPMRQALNSLRLAKARLAWLQQQRDGFDK